MSDIHALSGAYAVDALDDLERARFERHLAECAECQAEVASLRETAGLMTETTSTEPPPQLRSRVLAEIATVRPLPPVVPAGAQSASEPGRPRRRGRRLRLAALAAAAAVVAALGIGGTIWHPWSDDTTQTVTAADAVLGAADAQSSSLEFDGGASATVTHSDSVGRAVLVTHEMPPPPEGMVYQLWLDQPGVGMTSAGLMPVKADQTVVLDGDAATAKGAGITVEPAGGSEHPTSDPIALFDFGESA
jgi:anti-sigma factor RsiW